MQLIFQLQISVLSQGYSDGIDACQKILVVVAGVSGLVTEAQPVLGGIQRIPGRSAQLLDLVEMMLSQNDTLGNIRLENKLTVVTCGSLRDQNAMLVKQAEGCATQG